MKDIKDYTDQELIMCIYIFHGLSIFISPKTSSKTYSDGFTKHLDELIRRYNELKQNQKPANENVADFLQETGMLMDF